MVFGVLIFLSTTFKITGDDDFFWHLATGRYVVENKVVPDKDVFGYVTQNTEWIPFEWGWDVLSYGLYSLGGYNSILVFRSLIFMLIFYLYLRLLNKFKVSPVLSLIILFALLIGIMDRLSPRPHIITYLLFICLLYFLISFKYTDREKYQKRLFLIPVIFLIWGNIHMGVLAGGLLLFIFTVSEILIYLFPRKFSSNEIHPLTKTQLKYLVIVSIASAVVLLLNPHGFQTYIYAYGHTKMKLLDSINEWRSPFDPVYGGGFVNTIYKVFLFSGILILICSYIKMDLFFALVYAGFVVYSVRAMRFTVDYEIIMAFFIAVSLQFFSNRLNPNASVGKLINTLMYHNVFKFVLIVPMVYVILNIPNEKIYEWLRYYRPFGYGVDDNYLAVQLFDFMKENNIKGKPFNFFGTGGTLVWYFPDQKNFIDSRNLNDDIFNEYSRMMGMAPGFDKKLDEYGVDYVIYLDPDLIRRPKDLKGVIVNYMSRRPEWKLVFWDDKSFLFLKDEDKYSDVIRKFEYKILNPYNFIFSLQEFDRTAAGNPEQTWIELDRKSKSEPNGILFQSINQNLMKTVPSIFGTK